MKKLVLGFIVGAMGGYFFKKLQDEGVIESLCDSASDYASKVKESFSKTAQMIQEEGENISSKVKEKLKKVGDIDDFIN